MIDFVQQFAQRPKIIYCSKIAMLLLCDKDNYCVTFISHNFELPFFLTTSVNMI